ncbi:gliding motility-associated C-terminal domain-containing protein [Flavobacterium olei]|uniref:gliding motility-associated C-terminal domain-containing protein n=1 Tax=Flavobacterium olei TaxID=1886782 RepID=UPI00321B7AE0
MKSKITLLVLLIIFPVLKFTGNMIFAQTVSGSATNTGCLNSGIITASSVGLGATPQYQLLKAGVVVAPVSGDATQFTNVNVFTGLSTGSYTVKGRAVAGGTIFSSTSIAVVDGYTPMTISTPTKVAGCVGGNAVLTSTVTGGKATYTYTISTQSAPGTILQSSGPVGGTTFSFNPVPVGNYLIGVTDSCGQTVTGATSVSNPTVGLADIKLGSVAYPTYVPEFKCSSPIYINNELLFQYSATSSTLSTADAANFSWKIKYQGQLYGQDIDADGYSDIGGTGYSPLQQLAIMPAIANRTNVFADLNNMKVVLIDKCGNTKEFPVSAPSSSIGTYNCGGTGLVQTSASRLGCLPINITFTNIANPADVISKTLINANDFTSGFTAGATYHVTYVDAGGNTTGDFALSPSQNIVIPAVPSVNITQNSFGIQQNLNVLGYGRLLIKVSPYQSGEVINYEVTASGNPLVTIGQTGSAALDANGNVYLPRVNTSDPVGYWPKGDYTLNVTTSCGTKSLNVTVKGYNASLNGNTITAVCGGFNYVMNGIFDDATAYQVIIVSGPSSVGQTRDLASVTASLPFNGLSYGTYIFALRMKGGTQNVLTQTVTYDANNAIIVDKTNTGGYVCAAGASNGTLTITAASNSPAPGNIMEYALSTDGGINYGAYQSANTFGGLTDATYFFKIKDGCGNIITQSAQIGVAAAPDASANGLVNPATICKETSGTIKLDVNIFGALSYLWTGPGITASNKAEKDPLINYADLAVGANNFTCTVSLGAPCNSSTVSNLTINVNPAPSVIVTNPAPVCSPGTVNITAPEITAGSEPGLTYTYFSEETATVPVANPTAVATDDIFYIKGTNANGCSTIVPVAVTINTLPTAAIAYTDLPYCNTGTAKVELIGNQAGVFSSDPGLTINAQTGEIDLSVSSAGNHTVTYTFSDSTCSNTATATININALPTATIAYSGLPYCNRGTAAVTVTGTTGGAFIGDTGLIVDVQTGEVNLSASTPGTHLITYSFSNGTCSNTTTASIIINATTLPSALADITAECSVVPTSPTLTDACAGIITGTTATVFPITTQGTTVVTWSFDYGNGYTQTASQNIIIKDISAPVTPVLADVTAECSATPTVPVATDACAGTITGTTATVFPVTTQGTTIVTWSFDDGNGNIATANQNIIIKDSTAPVTPVLADITAECSVTPTVPVATDACAGTITGTTSTVFPVTTQGTTIVTWSFDDGNGNIATANQNIIIKDSTAPVTPVLADITAECSATPTVPVATDACAGTITGTTSTVFPVTTQGTTIITWSFNDGNGNVSTASQNIILNDTTPPVTPVLADIKGQCVVTPVAPTTTDNCAGTVTGTTTTPFPITETGTTIVTWTFDDGNGNSVTANQNVIISQIGLEGAETVACSATEAGYRVTLEVSGQAPFAASGTGAPGTWSANSWTSDLINSGTNYNVKLQDASACNTISVSGVSPNCCSFNVVCPTFPQTVVSCYNELPTASNLTRAQFEALGNGDGRIVNTNCGVIEITASNGADQGCNATVVRTYVVTEYEDTNKNGLHDAGENTILNSAQCTQNILMSDTTPPVFTGTLPETVINASCDTIPDPTNLTATDNCSTATINYEETRTEGDCSSRYTLLRTWTASDQCGNQTIFSQTVNVSCIQEVYNAVSANGDGLNDHFVIKGIDCYPDNVVRIYNRYGVMVYERSGYDNVTRPFEGFSDGRATIDRGNKLPGGTYFYTLEYAGSTGKIKKAGYLYVNSQ